MAILPDSNVKSLQQALITYANATGFTAANPGKADGYVGAKTVTAVIAMVPLLPAVPSEIRQIAQLGPIALASPQILASAQSFIKKNASTLYKSVIGLAAYQVATGNVPRLPATTPTAQVQNNPVYQQPVAPIPQRWFTTWWGMATIVGSAVAVTAVGFSLARR